MNAAAQEPAALKTLYDEHRWFELRNTIRGQKVPPLYSGAVSAAFNGSDAAKLLTEAIADNSNSADTKEARERLVEVEARAGKYREAVEQLDAILKNEPDLADEKNARVLFAAWGAHGDQSVRYAGDSAIHADVEKDGVRVPVSIHGKNVSWLLDTDANFSMISDAEAASLGIPIDESSAKVRDSAGGSAPVRTAVVDELTIGKVQIRNAAFLVLSDSQEPMRLWEPGKKGVLGLPIALALRAFRWSSDGTFEIRGQAPAEKGESNLALDGFNPVTQALFEGRELDFVVDSGDESGTEFWPRFSSEFAEVAKTRGTPDRRREDEVGGSNDRDVIVLPSVELRVGDMDAKLASVPIFPKPVGDDYHHGLLGMDVFSKASQVSFDFRSMQLRLSP
jgi:hypothetical protein